MPRVTPDEAFAMYDKDESSTTQLADILAEWAVYEPFYALRDDLLRVVDAIRIPLEERIFIPVLNLLTNWLGRK